jgi:hypothetical protein
VAGPVAFVTAWSVLGAVKKGYSPIEDPISRLAAVGASTRPFMTAGFAAFGAGVGLYASALRDGLSGPASVAAWTTAAASLGVAALPLNAELDGAHAAAAGLAYASLAATPLLGARALARGGNKAAAAASVGCGVVCGAALAASAVAGNRVGLWQRVGLSTGDVWIVATALWLTSGRSSGKPSA